MFCKCVTYVPAPLNSLIFVTPAAHGTPVMLCLFLPSASEDRCMNCMSRGSLNQDASFFKPYSPEVNDDVPQTLYP